MFNLKLSFLNVRRSVNRRNLLPLDFGTMYFLYPTESPDYIGFGSAGILEKLVDTAKTVLRKKDEILNYYKDESYF